LVSFSVTIMENIVLMGPMGRIGPMGEAAQT
jgi:hypothetical protein